LKFCMSSILLIGCVVRLSACQFKDSAFLSLNQKEDTSQVDPVQGAREVSELLDFVGTGTRGVKVNQSFAIAIKDAVLADPSVKSAEKEVAVKEAAARQTEARKDFNYTATALGGVEDVTDETAGVAVILNANRLLYDGGAIDASIQAENFAVEAAKQKYLATANERAVYYTHSWIELEKYNALNKLIEGRLGVLNPLLEQLDKVAAAGVGDVSQVAAAQRTVFMIQAEQKDVTEKLAQAELAFINGFGALPKKTAFDSDLISRAVPKLSISKLAETSPGLLANYFAYRSAEAAAVAVEAQDKFSVAFEAKLQRPFADSGYDSDETFGLVINKKFYRGDQLKAQIQRAHAAAESQAEQVRATYREGKRVISSSRQMIKAMRSAIMLANENAEVTRDEIRYLRKQLIIGGSTLDSVLSAEARLYDAESKEISFLADSRKAEVTILGATGKLLPLVGIK